MASLTRSIRRNILFAGMNKQQKRIWFAQHSGKHNSKYEDERKRIALAKKQSNDN